MKIRIVVYLVLIISNGILAQSLWTENANNDVYRLNGRVGIGSGTLDASLHIKNSNPSFKIENINSLTDISFQPFGYGTLDWVIRSAGDLRIETPLDVERLNFAKSLEGEGIEFYSTYENLASALNIKLVDGNSFGNFRILANNTGSQENKSLFFINGSLGRVGIGSEALDATLHIKNSNPSFKIENTNSQTDISFQPYGYGTLDWSIRSAGDIRVEAPLNIDRFNFAKNVEGDVIEFYSTYEDMASVLNIKLTDGNSFGDFRILANNRGSQVNKSLFYINGDLGRVGIGSEALDATLHIKNNNPSFKIENTNSQTDISFQPYGYETLDWVIRSAGDLRIEAPLDVTRLSVAKSLEGEGIEFYSTYENLASALNIKLTDGNSFGNFRILANKTSSQENKSLFFINGTQGNIGIGTENTNNYKLSVKGKIGAEEIEVIQTIADYVFEDDYNLRSLEEVEQFIIKNKHLPEIPSAKEFEGKKVAVGKMQERHLQKIEELTLYIIDQNKRIKKLEEQIKILAESK